MKQQIVIIMLLIISSCTVRDIESPYYMALQDLNSGKSILQQIFYEGKSTKYDNSKIKIFGYIDKAQSIVYLNDDVINPDLADSSFRNLLIVKLNNNSQSKNILKLNYCKGGDNLIELYGTFHIKKGVNGEDDSYYFTDIEKIYDFDARPKGIGTGEKFQCYPDPE